VPRSSLSVQKSRYPSVALSIWIPSRSQSNLPMIEISRGRSRSRVRNSPSLNLSSKKRRWPSSSIIPKVRNTVANFLRTRRSPNQCPIFPRKSWSTLKRKKDPDSSAWLLSKWLNLCPPRLILNHQFLKSKILSSKNRQRVRTRKQFKILMWWKMMLSLRNLRILRRDLKRGVWKDNGPGGRRKVWRKIQTWCEERKLFVSKV